MKTLALAAALLAAASTAALAGNRIHTLHIFTGSGEDGAAPETALLPDGSGNFYGTTYLGGSADLGTVFRLAADGSITTLHAFRPGRGGAHPFGSLLLQNDGSLIGGALRADGKGSVVYRLSPSGHETVLHRFKPKDETGYGQIWGMAAGPDGAIYGTSQSGGKFHCGTVWRLAADGSMSVVHTFGGFNRGDGCSPAGAPIFDGQGNLYGVTERGGVAGEAAGNGGAVYRVAPDGTESVLHAFKAMPDVGDGRTPTGPLLRDARGNLYGTTEEGDSDTSDGGVVYRVASGGTYAVVHAFPNTNGHSGDGNRPWGGVIQDADGNLYGTTSEGGLMNLGTVFKITPRGDTRILHWFEASDGTYPVPAPTFDTNGDLVGTTSSCGIDGGTCLRGTVYRLKRQ